MPDTPDWLKATLAAVSEAPTLLQGVQHFLQHLHNEMANGSGQTNPVTVVKDALDAAEEVTAALQATPSASGNQGGPIPAADAGSADRTDPDTASV